MAAPTENTDLPRALVSTIIKNKLASSTPSDDPERQQKVNLNKDALLAFVESAKIFISYLTATANDICHESKRQIINVDDVFNALEDIDFGEFVVPLKEALDAFREESKEKNAKKAERTRKRKQDEQALAEQAGQTEGQEAEPNLDSAVAEGPAAEVSEEIEPVGLISSEEVMAGAPIEPVAQSAETLPTPVLPPELPEQDTDMQT